MAGQSRKKISPRDIRFREAQEPPADRDSDISETDRLAFAVGEGESDAFKRQSAMLAKMWGAPEPLICQGHHFSMLDGLNGGALLDLALRTAAA